MFRVEEPEQLVAFMQRHPFAVVASHSEGALVATHLPLTVRAEGDELYLRGHFAKANPQWRELEAGSVLAVFSGPHAYVSPRLYEASESVPTWNYLAVHATGAARIVLEPEESEALLYELIERHEPDYRQRWEGLAPRYREGMLRGIVAFELKVERLEGKAKLSQNKTRAERERIVESLAAEADPLARETGVEMLRLLAGRPVGETEAGG